MSVLIDLFKGLTTELRTQLSPLTIDRRYMPRIDVEDLDTLKISIYIEATEREEIARAGIDLERHTFGIAVQKAVGTQVANDTDGNPVLDGIDNLAAGDAVMNIMEQIKALWRLGGPLRDKPTVGCKFLEMVHEPPYEPLHLLRMGIYTSILDVTYQTND